MWGERGLGLGEREWCEREREGVEVLGSVDNRGERRLGTERKKGCVIGMGVGKKCSEEIGSESIG